MGGRCCRCCPPLPPPPPPPIVRKVHKALLDFFNSDPSKSYIVLYNLDPKYTESDALCTSTEFGADSSSDTYQIAHLELEKPNSGYFVSPNLNGTMLTIEKNSPRNLALHVVTIGENKVFAYQKVDTGDLTSPYLPNTKNGNLPCKTENIILDENHMIKLMPKLFFLKEAFYWSQEGPNNSFNISKREGGTTLYWQPDGDVVTLKGKSPVDLRFRLDILPS